jgi:hypothetical protein
MTPMRYSLQTHWFDKNKKCQTLLQKQAQLSNTDVLLPHAPKQRLGRERKEKKKGKKK